MVVKSVKTVEKVNVDSIPVRYKKMLATVRANNISLKEERKINYYTCEKCGKIIKTIDKEPGVTPFLISCDSCEGMAQSSFYSEIAPDKEIDYEWFRPSLQYLSKCTEGEIEHVLNGGLLKRPYDNDPLFTVEQRQKLDKEFIDSSTFKKMKRHFANQRGMKKFRNPMVNLTPKKKKRK